jgi:hypothetical protein
MVLFATVAWAPALAIANSAKTFKGWECALDLKEALGGAFSTSLPEVVRTTRTHKLCTGGPSGNIMITCKAQIPGWAGGNRTFPSVPCQISRTQCGQSGFVLANNTSLKIKADGEATLDCKRVGAG